MLGVTDPLLRENILYERNVSLKNVCEIIRAVI